MGPNSSTQKQNKTKQPKQNLTCILCHKHCKTEYVKTNLILTTMLLTHQQLLGECYRFWGREVETSIMPAHEWTWFTPHASSSESWSHSALEILNALLATKANRRPQTFSFLVSALNSLEPAVNWAEFYLFESSLKEKKGHLFVSLETGIQMSEWRK